jgi:hypothetical protein
MRYWRNREHLTQAPLPNRSLSTTILLSDADFKTGEVESTVI